MLSFRSGVLAAATLFALAACEGPPPESYATVGLSAKAPAGVSIGTNAVGEKCIQQRLSDGAADVYCGDASQPARIRAAGKAGPEALAALATASTWRSGLNDRFNCADPQPTTILSGQPAVLLQCTQRLGGWPHRALVASVNGNGWYADGVLPSQPAMERAIGVMAGVLQADAAGASSATDALAASRLASQSFGSNDVNRFEQLMTLAARANQNEQFAEAEKAYRAALDIHEKALGRDNPATSAAMLNLALQISNQKRFPEAEALFTRADRIVGASPDASQRARLTHYRALHARNQGKLEEALAQLDKAEPAYAELLPPDVLNARPSAIGRGGFSTNSSASDLLSNRDLLTDVTTRAGLLGLIEVRRYKAVVLRSLGRFAESDAALKSASTLAAGNGMRQPVLAARMTRTSAAIYSARGDAAGAADAYETAVNAFTTALPDSRPVAETHLLRAAELQRAGEIPAALGACQSAVAVLRAIKIGSDARLLAPCLDIYAAASEKRSGAERQALLVQMFEAAQLSQGGVTSAQIAQATARLGENSRDPRVGDAIRARQDARNKLTDLYRERDQATEAKGPDAARGPVSAELDKRIADAQEAMNNADLAVQAASPNYGQLVQQLVPVSAMTAALSPGEGFVSMTLTETGGWSFLLRDGQVSIAPITGGTRRVAELVKRVRASIESETAVPPPFDIKAAEELYAVSMGGLDRGMQGMKALIVAPSGPLLSVPFGLLLTGPADAANLPAAPWLLRRMEISHVPAAANFVSLRKIAGTSRATRPWFGFGDFRPVTLPQAQRSKIFATAECADSAKLLANLPILPAAIKELDLSRRQMNGAASDQLLGTQFTAAAVLKTQLKDYRILHFATHALLPSELKCQDEAAIVTSAPPGAANADGALLRASEVTDMNLDADTVILSACNSGGPGGSGAGESLSGLARSFFYAGARSLMVTHWSVNDQTAAFLVVDSMRRLSSGENPGIAGAMRAAQLFMLDNAGKGLPPGLDHPFYWAPFALIGEGTNKKVATAALQAAVLQ